MVQKRERSSGDILVERSTTRTSQQRNEEKSRKSRKEKIPTVLMNMLQANVKQLQIKSKHWWRESRNDCTRNRFIPLSAPFHEASGKGQNE